MTPPMKPQDSARQFRVFISSTFRDLKAERDHLVKFVFPQLRRLCQRRGVTWTEVDLRWGITDEETADGRALPHLLEEIDRCGALIGLLGERYGWIPEHLPDSLVSRQPWLAEPGRRSVTELEIAYGCLRSPRLRGRALFYFRDPGYVDRLPAGTDRSDFVSESEPARVGLQQLKSRIRRARDESACTLREGFRNPEELGRWVLDDLTSLIDRVFPEGDLPDPASRDVQDQTALARSHLAGYVSSRAQLARLDAHVAGDGPPLVVTGRTGCGKSALLANWYLAHRAQHPRDLGLIHFIGAAPESADPRIILQGLIRQLACRLGPEDGAAAAGSADAGALARELTRLLHKVASRQRVLLVLDGLDQVDRQDAAEQLGWLPDDWPRGCRVIVSTQEGESLAACRRRGWTEELRMPGLSADDRRTVTCTILAGWGKRLSEERIARIVSAPQTENPMFLRMMLDELRQFGEHERLGQRIDAYLAAPDLEALCSAVLARWMEDFGADLVPRTLSLLWAARRGLSEAELLALLGGGDMPLPRAHTAAFFLAAESHLACRSGLLTLKHAPFRDAVESMFLAEPARRRECHLTLARHFLREESQDDFAPAWADRLLSEVPWQLAKATDWPSLAEFLADLSRFDSACRQGLQFEWMVYWQVVQRSLREDLGGAMDIPGNYLRRLRALPEESQLQLSGALGQFLQELGYHAAARECLALEAEFLRKSAPAFLLASNLNDEDNGLVHEGRPEEALAVFDKAEGLLRSQEKSDDSEGVLASVLMNRANALR